MFKFFGKVGRLLFNRRVKQSIRRRYFYNNEVFITTEFGLIRDNMEDYLSLIFITFIIFYNDYHIFFGLRLFLEIFAAFFEFWTASFFFLIVQMHHYPIKNKCLF
jgi:hypothetical protein